MNFGLVFYCESHLQLQIFNALKRSARDQWSACLILGEHNALNQANYSSHIATAKIPATANFNFKSAITMASAAIQDCKKKGVRGLVLFQDQSLRAFALSTVAKKNNIPVILIQDGFLSFSLDNLKFHQRALWPVAKVVQSELPILGKASLNMRLYDYLYNRHFFGHTKPDLVFVHGSTMKKRLVAQFGIAQERIHKVGPLNDIFRPNKRQVRRINKEISGIMTLQPGLSFGRMHPKAWRSAYLPLISHMASYGFSLALHPAQSPDEIESIRSAIEPSKHQLLQAGPISSKNLGSYDVLLTANSTTAFEAYSYGLQTITYKMDGARDNLPAFRETSIFQATSHLDISVALNVLQATGSFPNDGGDTSLDDHFAALDVPVEKRIRKMLELLETEI